jgi:long-chain-fatty-acyl-CoA reductase
MPSISRRIPFIIHGTRHDPGRDARVMTIQSTGAQLVVPTLKTEHVDLALRSPSGLADLTLDEIVAFLHNAGQNWKSEEYSRRRIYIQQLVDVLGYSQKMAEREANWIAYFLSAHTHIYDTVAAELGSRHILDRWIPSEESDLRAFPKGRVFHLLPGNVPLAGLMSLLRALVTKNTSILKAASDDPITPVHIALSFADVDSRHPVTRAVSVFHWRGDEAGPLQERLLAASNAVVAWGGKEAIEWTSRHAPAESEVLNFGPRRSLALIGADANPREAARALAHDSSIYDQRACFSVQQAFVETPILQQLLAELEQACALFAELLPRATDEFDDRAARALAQLESHALGNDVRASPDGWSVSVCAPEDIDVHPLGRTLYLHPVDDLRQALAHVSPEIQTVAVMPWRRSEALRDQVASAGASRIVELGLSNVFRLGGAHDGMHPLQRLVRFVANDHPSTRYVKGMSVRLDQTKLLEEGRFLEFVP